MPCPHNEITIVQRSQRQSAVAAAAYQSGEKLFCEYDQQVKHYPEKRDFVVWTGHFVSLLSVIGGWGGVLPPHFGQKKSRRPFSDFLLGVPLCERRVFSCKSSGQVDPM